MAQLFTQRLIYFVIQIILLLYNRVDATAPTIDYSHNMRILKLPKSTPIGSLIYRLKGSDGDPNTQLVFGVSGLEARSLLDVVPVPKSWNEADVYLRNTLERPLYNFTVYVTDGDKTTQVESTLVVVDTDQVDLDGKNESMTASSPFVNPKHVFHVPENSMPDEPIGFVTALESQKSNLPVRFELRGKGSDKFSIKYVFGPKGQSRADIVLAQKVDYEKQNLFLLKVLALNAWTNTKVDTRNVATMDIVITIGDVQDTAPIFKSLPHSLKLTNMQQVGDVVAKIEAEDGDYADQRPVNFALDAGSPLATYFDIDKSTGEIKLLKPMSELLVNSMWDSSSATAWSILTVFASEMPDTSSYDHLWPPMYSRVELPLVLVDEINLAPQFIGGWQSSDSKDPLKKGTKLLHGFISESVSTSGSDNTVKWYTNSSTSSSVPRYMESLVKSVNGRPLVVDLNQGANGTFDLTLEGADANLFTLSPTYPVSRQTLVTINVAESANKTLFDHDSDDPTRQKYFSFYIVARDFGTTGRLSAKIHCIIELVDENDNAPQFESDLYVFNVYENAQAGQLIGSVRAKDLDQASSGNRVRYVALTGVDSHLFRVDQDSGQVSVEAHLDRERKSTYLFLIEARDSSGLGRSNFSQILVNVLDVNDNAPVFLQPQYSGVLLADGTFYQPLIVKALDADEPNSANSQVAYEIIAGNINEQFSIDSVSGAIYPTASLQLGEDQSLPAPKNPNANVIPQIPSILKEPIAPFTAPTTTPKPDMAGKILPSHEMEDDNLPRQPHSSQSGRPRVHFDSSSESNSPGQTRPAGRLSTLPALDVEQMPSLDLLLSLESNAESGEHQHQARDVHSQSSNILRVPPVTNLIVRAHDFGIPLRSSTVKVNIYNQALLSRTMSVILNGTAEQIEQRREAIERAFGSISGSRATIESVDALSDSSSISVARMRLASPQYSLIDLTDLTAFLSAMDYHPHPQHGGEQPRQPAIITHYITSDRAVPSGGGAANNITTGSYNDVHTFAIENSTLLERRLLIYIIIVGVCILALLVIWMIYSCSREDRVKLVESSSPNSRRTNAKQTSTESYVRRGDFSSSNKEMSEKKTTHAKTAQTDTESGLAAGYSSAIGNNLSKVAKNPSNSNDLLYPTAHRSAATGALKPTSDHFSMYNGQVWFEPARPMGRPHNMLLTSRRASSAPSGGSLDSALHAAMSSRYGDQSSLLIRAGAGQFFPNTIGYTENLSALAAAQVDAYNRSRQAGKMSTRQRHRGGRVAPMADSMEMHTHSQRLTNKPTRAGHSGGQTNAAFEPDQEPTSEATDNRRSFRSSSAASSGDISLALDSDQELLGFDSSGTPIIATHARPNGVKQPVLIADEPRPPTTPRAMVQLRTPQKTSEPVVAPPAPPKLPTTVVSPVGAAVSPAATIAAATTAESSATSSRASSAQQRRKEQLRRTNSQGDNLMSELNERLSTRRQQTSDGTGTVEIGGVSKMDDESNAKKSKQDDDDDATTKSKPDAQGSQEKQQGPKKRDSLAQMSESEQSSLAGVDGDMRNRELLEKQSIFAMTYSGLATDKPRAVS